MASECPETRTTIESIARNHTSEMSQLHQCQLFSMLIPRFSYYLLLSPETMHVEWDVLVHCVVLR